MDRISYTQRRWLAQGLDSYDIAAGHALLIGARGVLVQLNGAPVVHGRGGFSGCIGGAPEVVEELVRRKPQAERRDPLPQLLPWPPEKQKAPEGALQVPDLSGFLAPAVGCACAAVLGVGWDEVMDIGAGSTGSMIGLARVPDVVQTIVAVGGTVLIPCQRMERCAGWGDGEGHDPCTV